MRQRLFHIILALVLITVTACSLSSALAPKMVIQQTPGAMAYLLVTSDPKAPPTPTPFQPISPSSTYLAPPTFTPTPTITPTATATTIPTAMSIPPTSTIQVNQAEGLVNILMLGSDARPNDGGYRTDVILWVSLNPKLGTATLISFPRDLWVYIPGWGDQRINTAMAHGFATMQDTFQYNFGIRPDYYVMMNFDGFKSIIDTLGGVDVNASQNLTDACDLPQATNGQCSVGPGVVHMNGVTALWYVRSRYSSSDFDRTRREQEVVLATFKRLISLDAITKASNLYSQFKNTVDNNVPLTTILSLLPMATKVTDTSQVRRFAIGPSQVYNWVTPDGAMVLVPIQSACLAVIQQAFSNP